jgi:hypothetical protein
MRRGMWLITACGVACLCVAALSGPCAADELITKPCSELMSMAENYRQDLKTVDTMLNAAIDAGTMDRIRNYKMKRAAARKQLESVLKALDLKECGGSR